METRSAKRRKLRNPNHSSENNTGEDRITDLPDAILHHILFLLPIKLVVQTSILSKRWRTLWHTLPDLDFTSIVPSGTRVKKIGSLNNLGNGSVITRILSLRDKLSDVRSLRFDACMSFSGLQALIRSAVRLGVQELDIRVETSDIFNFPRSLITHDCLRVLKVKACPSFRLPPSRIVRSGFQTLQTLSLSDVYLDKQSSLRDMFSDCSFPQLKKLHLKHCDDLIHLKVGCLVLEELVLKKCSSLQGLEIFSPRLVTLKVSSCFDGVSVTDTWVDINTPRLHTLVWVDNPITSKNCLQNLVCLHEATIGFVLTNLYVDAKKFQSGSPSFLSGLSHAVSLTLERKFVQIISKNNSLVAILFNPFVKLNSLELQTSEVTDLASVLMVCPMIHTLIIKITYSHKREKRVSIMNSIQCILISFSNHVSILLQGPCYEWDIIAYWGRLLLDLLNSRTEQYWDTKTKDLEPLLHHLKVVKIQGFSEDHIKLVEFLLQHGKVLQDLILGLEINNSSDCHRHEKLKSRIMGLSRSSLDTKLAFH
ncbi:putative F-box domain, FBD domain, leucine-rich repeat domain superfamily [Helianthus annuus]|nr:putative F-box domain, FBD domain, leucine-rich repeat domain superfamily [Helianthus annuus]